jgi:enoyl-CoA hydratase/carnithine racemase
MFMLGEILMYECIKAETTKFEIGIIKLNRPNKRNAISIQMRREISDCLYKWQVDDSIKVVIITGEESTFSAGFDLSEFNDQKKFQELFDSSSKYHRDVWSFSKPLIAAVNGPALGGGFDLSLLCDIRICSENAYFGHPEIRFGAPPLVTPLRSVVGEGIARELCLTGRKINAQEAYRIGIVSYVCSEDLMEKAIGIAKDITIAPLETLTFTKKYMMVNYGRGFEESFILEHDRAFQEVLLKKAAEGTLI